MQVEAPTGQEGAFRVRVWTLLAPAWCGAGAGDIVTPINEHMTALEGLDL